MPIVKKSHIDKGGEKNERCNTQREENRPRLCSW